MGTFDNKPKKKVGYSIAGMNLTHGARTYPYNDTHDSYIWDWDAPDNDGDGYRDGSVGDSNLWDY